MGDSLSDYFRYSRLWYVQVGNRVSTRRSRVNHGCRFTVRFQVGTDRAFGARAPMDATNLVVVLGFLVVFGPLQLDLIATGKEIELYIWVVHYIIVPHLTYAIPGEGALPTALQNKLNASKQTKKNIQNKLN